MLGYYSTLPLSYLSNINKTCCTDIVFILFEAFQHNRPSQELAGSGQPQYATAKEDKILLRMSKSDREMIAPEVCAAWRNYRRES